MAVDVTIEGAEKLALLAKALKQVGDRELRLELLKGLREATKPTKEKVKESFKTNLPQRGGLAALISGDAKLTTQNRMAGKNPGVRIKARAGHDIKRMDKGRLRHPIYGSRKKWVTQAIEPGVFSKPIEDDAPQMRDEILAGMERVALKFLDKH